MRIEIIDGYEIHSENGDYKKIIYKDYSGNKVTLECTKELEKEFKLRKKEGYANDYRTRRYVDVYANVPMILEHNSYNDLTTIPDIEIIKEEIRIFLIREIWKLPAPQDRRVYMHCVNNYSLTKIAKIENCSIPTVKQSIDIGKEKLQEKIKKFLF